jgi:hypothetical protein
MKRTKKTLFVLFVAQVCLSNLYSQTPSLSPSLWDSFINSNRNTLICDTFRMQTFEGSPMDNWGYTTSGTTYLVSAASSGYSEDKDKTMLMIKYDAKFALDTISLDKYDNPKIALGYAGRNLSAQEFLEIKVIRTSGINEADLVYSFVDGYTSPWGHKEFSKAISLEFKVRITRPNYGSSYYFDNALAFGDIQKYSLFNGMGEWGDTIRWSHLPAARNRSALINGDVIVKNAERCDTVAISDGELYIAPNASLTVNSLFLHNNASVLSKGEFVVRDKFSYTHTFPQKGVWYFISFPFDVYLEDIDSAFELKDETFVSIGNYFYVQKYNGHKRANSQGTSSAWEVLPESTGSDGQPVFFKNKGYLIALDNGADTTTMTFSINGENIPEGFGRHGEIVVDASAAVGHGEHEGWNLCGNPLLSALPVKQLESASLDGYVYVYDGTKYKAIALNDDYALAPFSAFFVKAGSPVSLLVEAVAPRQHSILPVNVEVTSHTNEPWTMYTSNDNTLTPPYFLLGSTFHIKNAPEKGILEILDITGRSVRKESFRQKESREISLSNLSGFYIISLRAKSYKCEYKLIL